MRRALLAAALALVGALVPACAGTERPEGIVERWLISLNQGAAGRPERYATAGVSEEVLPGWERLEPGELDVIEVGKGAPGEGGRYQVPFRIVRQDGTEHRFLAVLVDGRVVAVPKTAVGPIESAVARVGLAGWLAAAGTALLLVLATAGLMALVPERRAARS